MRIVQGARRARRPGVTRRLDVGWAAGEEDAVHARQDLGDVERSLEHRNQQRQAVGGLDDGGYIFLTDRMKWVRANHASVGRYANNRSLAHKNATLSRGPQVRALSIIFHGVEPAIR